MRQQTRYILLDPMQQFSREDEPEKLVEGKLCYSWEELRSSEEAKIVYVPLDIDNGETVIEAVCTLAEGLQDIVVGVDELDAYLGGNRFTCPRALYRVAMYGRHFNVDMIAIARRLANLPINLTSQVRKLYVFKQTEPRDLEYLTRLTSSETVAQVQALGEFEFLALDI